MVEEKPYQYGLIVAGLSVVAVGLFIMTREQPHIYGTMCTLGVIMVCVGTAWSLCRCFPKVTEAPEIQRRENLEDAAAEAERFTDALCNGPTNTRGLPEVLKSHCHSCPTLHLV